MMKRLWVIAGLVVLSLSAAVSSELGAQPYDYDECVGIGEAIHQDQTALERRATCERALKQWHQSPYPEGSADISQHQFDRLFMETVRARTFLDSAELRAAVAAMEEIAWDPHWDFVSPSPPASDLRWLWLYTGQRDKAWQETASQDLNTANPAMPIAVYADVVVYVDRGDIVEAERVLEIAKAAYKADTEYYFWPDVLQSADVVFQLASGDFEAALNILENAIGVEELGPYGQRWHSIALRELGYWELAVAAAQRSVDTASKSEDLLAEGLANMTLALTLFQNPQRTEEDVQRLIDAVERASEIAIALPISDFLTAAVVDLRARMHLAEADAISAKDAFIRAVTLERSLLDRYVQFAEAFVSKQYGPESLKQIPHDFLVLERCLRANCIPPEPRQCEYEGAGIACVPVQW